jgi:hypothetical protein
MYVHRRAYPYAADALMLHVFFPQLGLFTRYHDMARMRATRGRRHDKDKLSSGSADPVASSGSRTSDLRLCPSLSLPSHHRHADANAAEHGCRRDQIA